MWSIRIGHNSRSARCIHTERVLVLAIKFSHPVDWGITGSVETNMVFPFDKLLRQDRRL